MSAGIAGRHTGLSTADRDRDRWLWLAVAAGATAALCTARWLVPDRTGLGTHTQLGLPPCLFHALSGLPCPACGLTTCFAHMARGQIANALHSSALGVPLFAAVALALPWSVWASVRGHAFFETFARMRVQRVCLVAICALLAQWVVRVGCLLLG